MSTQTIIIIRQNDSTGDAQTQEAVNSSQKSITVNYPPTPADYWHVVQAAVEVLKGQ